jgi:hypothetical protein
MILPLHKPPNIEAKKHRVDGNAWCLSKVKPRTTLGEKELAILEPSTAKLKRGYRIMTNAHCGRWFIRKRTGRTRIPAANTVVAITSREKSTIQSLPPCAYSTGSRIMETNESGRTSRKKTHVETNAIA